MASEQGDARDGRARRVITLATGLTTAASLMAIPWSLSVAGKLAAVLSLVGWMGALSSLRTGQQPQDQAARTGLRLAWAWALGCIAYLLAHLLQVDGATDWRRLDAASRMLALSGVVFVPFVTGMSLRSLREPLAVAGLWFGAITLSQFVAHPGQRSFGLYSYENMMGFAAMGNALLLAALPRSARAGGLALTAAGLAGSLVALALSGTRGAWPGLLALGWLWWSGRVRPQALAQPPAALWSTWPKRLGVLTLVSALLMSLAVPLTTRLVETTQDVSNTVKGDRWGSLGMRLVLSGMAVDMIRARPWTGNGLVAFHERVVRWADEIGIHKTAMERGFQNPHNQYLHWAQSLGLPAAAACLMLIVALPATVAWRRGEGDPDAQRALRALAFTVPLYFLSEAVLDRHHGAQWFCLVVGLLIGLCLNPARQPASPRA